MAWSNASYNTWYSTSDYSDVLVDDRHRCRVEGCRRKQVSTRSPDGRKNYSNHCFNHNCSRTYHDDSLGVFHCTTSKDEGERYCPDHLKCGVTGCTREGEWLGAREYIPWYCLDHRCRHLSCRSKATDPTQQRCTTHFTKCSVSTCPRPCHQHRDGRLDIVCAVHYGTFKCVWGAGCSRRTGYNTRYCPAHKCAIPSCTSSRDPAGGNPARAACTAHTCTSPACPNPIAHPSSQSTTSHHCAAHSCLARACPNARHTASGSEFCLAHTCATPSCRGEALAPGSSHCARHVCADGVWESEVERGRE